tara:strand:+ start:60 stop:533 length:474 start_codon:yes stop_codon:yes gene_type:complete
MPKKEVDPKLEPILDKIEEFDPDRSDRLRENYGKEPEVCPVHDKVPMPNGILSGVGRSVVTETTTSSDGLVISKHTVPVKRVPKAEKPVKPKQQRHDYRFCNHCGKKGAYTFKSAFETLEFCKYCRPKKKWKDIPEGLLEPAAEPKKKSWLARLLRF